MLKQSQYINNFIKKNSRKLITDARIFEGKRQHLWAVLKEDIDLDELTIFSK